jgi:pimeloyl-ACP methyl ester carboxylesterase
VAQQRPDLLRRLILAEPGGELDATLDPTTKAALAAAGAFHRVGREDRGRRCRRRARRSLSTRWKAPATGSAAAADEAAAARQRLHADRPESRQPPPFREADAEAIKMPTLFIGGAGPRACCRKCCMRSRAHVPNSKTAMIPNTTHPMFEQAPQAFSRSRAGFLAADMQTIRSTDTTWPISKWQRPPLVCVHGTLGDFRTWYRCSGRCRKSIA